MGTSQMLLISPTHLEECQIYMRPHPAKQGGLYKYFVRLRMVRVPFSRGRTFDEIREDNRRRQLQRYPRSRSGVGGEGLTSHVEPALNNYSNIILQILASLYMCVGTSMVTSSRKTDLA